MDCTEQKQKILGRRDKNTQKNYTKKILKTQIITAEQLRELPQQREGNLPSCQRHCSHKVGGSSFAPPLCSPVCLSAGRVAGLCGRVGCLAGRTRQGLETPRRLWERGVICVWSPGPSAGCVRMYLITDTYTDAENWTTECTTLHMPDWPLAPHTQGRLKLSANDLKTVLMLQAQSTKSMLGLEAWTSAGPTAH